VRLEPLLRLRRRLCVLLLRSNIEVTRLRLHQRCGCGCCVAGRAVDAEEGVGQRQRADGRAARVCRELRVLLLLQKGKAKTKPVFASDVEKRAGR
jgi:hypothetical protein